LNTKSVYTGYINPASLISFLGEGMSQSLEVKVIPRVAILNALPLNAIPKDAYYFDILCKRTTIEEVADIVKHSLKVESYIRHESTVRTLNKLLNMELKPSAGLYTYEKGDILIIVTLKKPQRGQEVEVQPDDLEYFKYTVSTIISTIP